MNRTLILVGVLCAALVSALFYKSNPVTNTARDYAQSVATASAATYVTLRTLNAVLSTAQEVEVGGSFFVQGSAQPLKALEPIDDTIERIASFVFTLMVVTGVMTVAMGPIGAIGFVMIAVACAIWAFEQRRQSKVFFAGFGRRLFSYGIFLALALPLAFVLAALFADWLTADVWAQHIAVIENITGELEGDPEAQGSVWEVLRDADRYREFASRIWSEADTLIASYVAILAVFVFKVFLLPGLILGAFFVLTRWVAGQRAQ